MTEIQQKITTVEKYLKRVEEDARDDWKNEKMPRETLLFNLEHLSRATISCATLVLQKKGLGNGQNSRDVLDVLLRSQILGSEVITALKKMVGFITLAAHDYNSLNVEILESMVNYELHFFKDFCKAVSRLEL